MLEHSFIHLPGIGGKTERGLWQAGLTRWGALADCGDELLRPLRLTGRRLDRLRAGIEDSQHRLDARDSGFFCDRLPPAEAWRLFADFADDAAYLDIETNGWDAITCVVVHRAGQTMFFVRDRNLHELPLHLAGARLLVTYNGKCFDWPVIRACFSSSLLPEPAAHLDLRYPFARLGFRGGLKGIEKTIGLRRPDELADIDGYSAVWLWQQHLAGDGRALPALLRYCAEDVLNLKFLAEYAHNRLADAAGVGAVRFDRPAPAACPCLPQADGELMARCRAALAAMMNPWG